MLSGTCSDTRSAYRGSTEPPASFERLTVEEERRRHAELCQCGCGVFQIVDISIVEGQSHHALGRLAVNCRCRERRQAHRSPMAGEVVEVTTEGVDVNRQTVKVFSTSRDLVVEQDQRTAAVRDPRLTHAGCGQLR
jgi:hypothetical protein